MHCGHPIHIVDRPLASCFADMINHYWGFAIEFMIQPLYGLWLYSRRAHHGYTTDWMDVPQKKKYLEAGSCNPTWKPKNSIVKPPIWNGQS
ncbi:hypothetical protein MJO29_014701, partial [Puccinia striiformis f. sp. tritici]